MGWDGMGLTVGAGVSIDLRIVHCHPPSLFPTQAAEQTFKTVFLLYKLFVAKDCLLTLVKSRLALGSLGWLFVTKPKMAEYTDK